MSKKMIPLAILLATCLFSATTFAAGKTTDTVRMPYDRFSFDASSSQGNIILASGNAVKRVESDSVGVSPETYTGNYQMATVYAERMYLNSSGQWYRGHQSTNIKGFQSNNFQLYYNNDADANSNGTFRLECYSNAVEFGIGGWWNP